MTLHISASSAVFSPKWTVCVLCCYGNTLPPSLCIADVICRYQQCNKYLNCRHGGTEMYSMYCLSCKQYGICLVLQVKCTIFLSEFNQIWEFLHRLSKKSPMCNFTEIPLVGVALIHADGQTHRQTDTQTDRQTDRRRNSHDEASRCLP